MRRLARLGNGPLVCILCGYTDPIALMGVTAEWLMSKGIPQSLFEKHHPSGREHDPEFIFPICRNCHAKATEGLYCAGVSMMAEPDQDTREALRLEGLAAFHDETAEALRRWAAEKRSKVGNE